MPASSRGITKPGCMGRLALNDNSASDANVALGQKQTKADMANVLSGRATTSVEVPSSFEDWMPKQRQRTKRICIHRRRAWCVATPRFHRKNIFTQKNEDRNCAETQPGHSTKIKCEMVDKCLNLLALPRGLEPLFSP